MRLGNLLKLVLRIGVCLLQAKGLCSGLEIQFQSTLVRLGLGIKSEACPSVHYRQHYNTLHYRQQYNTLHYRQHYNTLHYRQHYNTLHYRQHYNTVHYRQHYNTLHYSRDGQAARNLKKLEPQPSSFELEARTRPE